ncbi:diacylglycerol/lipid kinase family protein [Sphingomonas sp. MMS24-J13]|uniref:diacylglycerol/lipid kinase family protein n=1 Tax=Sphingomonas sp. MMS24-J13 TaxID=3238686 RepID=UPI00384BF49C
MTNPPLPVLVNREGGAAAKAGEGLRDTIDAAFAAAGTQAEIRLLAADEIADAVKHAAGQSPRIAVAGGDGTMACAAQALRGAECEMALLPLGTLNHLARDLKVPAAIGAAAQLAVQGRAIAIDVGTVNGQRFVNNASVGIYSEMVRERDAVRERRHWPKWLATVPAAWATLERLAPHRLRIDLGHGGKSVRTPLLFIGNGVYSLDRGEVGCRSTLQDGRLGVYAVAHRSRTSLLWFAARAIVGRADPQADFELMGETERLQVAAHGRHIEIAMDGEVRRMATPLKFAVERGALRVVAGEA